MPIVYGLYLISSFKWQNRLLLVASYIFYGAWDWRFLSLILFSTVVDYVCGLRMESLEENRPRRFYLWISLISNLGLLGVFKYFNFFAETFSSLVNRAGLSVGDITLELILPVGISFYTFQTLSYTIDIYRRQIPAEKNFFTFALYVSFFPQLVAGPIERASHLLPQFNKPRRITSEDLSQGLWLITWGYVLKVFLADNLAEMVNEVFAQTGRIPGGEALLSLYAFAFQIFGDFAGYSSIAIGIAKLMGIDLMTNFLFPYFVTNPRDFWANWHISLSTWLRDYLYVPLGGNRSGLWMTYRNLFLTMLLGGLWHGAQWTFVLWGLYQGMVLILHRLIVRRTPHTAGERRDSRLWWIIKVIFMFHVTCLGWLLFRADSLQQINDMLYSICFNMSETSPVIRYMFTKLAFFCLPIICLQILQIRYRSGNQLTGMPAMLRYAVYAAVYYMILCFGEYGSQPFIYFQF